MQNKPSSKSWTDIQLVITSIAVAFTLGFWNLFASPEKRPTGGSQAAAELPTGPVETTVPPLPLQIGQVILINGATPPAQPQVAASRSRKNKGGGGAVTTTGSSR